MTIASISNKYSYGFFPSFYRFATSEAYTLLYTIIGAAARILGNEQIQRKYQLLSDFYWQRAHIYSAYTAFGSNLINPSINLEKVEKLIFPFNQKKLDVLFEQKARYMPASIPFNKNKLSPIKNTNGVCFAASLKFLSKYFQGIKKGRPIEEVIYTVSKKFKEGVSEKTAIINHLQEAETLSPTTLWRDKIQPTASLYRLNVQKPTIGKQQIQSLTDQLNDGGYLATIHDGTETHACAYIKYKNHRFLFDPYHGTTLIPKGSDENFFNVASLGSRDKILFFQTHE